jgi:hypothetical protein
VLRGDLYCHLVEASEKPREDGGVHGGCGPFPTVYG